MRAAVVGHVEWVRFARVPHVPVSGEIVHASDSWEDAGGGGAVAAVQLRKLAGAALFLTALGRDEPARRTLHRLGELRVDVRQARRPVAQRLAFTHLDDGAERTITVLGERIGPLGSDPLPWEDLHTIDGLYFTAGDAAALQAARAAKVLVATPRARDTLLGAGVELDVVVGSADDPGERFEATRMRPPPKLVVLTEGARGGRWIARDGSEGHFEAAPLPGPREDAYGCGDSFAAGLTFALGDGDRLEDALALAARCGAACLTGRGPYAGQLELDA